MTCKNYFVYVKLLTALEISHAFLFLVLHFKMECFLSLFFPCRLKALTNETSEAFLVTRTAGKIKMQTNDH